MSELPKGWSKEKLFNLCKVSTGKVDANHASDNGEFSFFTCAMEPLKSETYSYEGKLIILPGNGANVGLVNYYDGKIEAYQRTYVLSDITIHPKYLYWQLRYKWKDTNLDKQYGSATNYLKMGNFKTYEVPVAPLEEQKRIADKLDSVLAKVEAAQARLDKIPAILKRFRQSVLAAATSGELTKNWREENEHLSDEESTWLIKDVPDSWNVKFLPEVASSRLGKMLDKNKNTGLATKYLGNVNLRWHKFELEDLKEILVSQKEQEELNIQDGDLLLCEGGEPGRGAVWRGGKTDIVFQKALHRVRCADELNPDFLLFSIEDDYFSKRLSLLYTGTTIKHLTGKALKKYPVRVPPLKEQLEIVNRVNALLEHSNTVENQYNAAKARLDKLTQSILAKAFKGELLSNSVDSKIKSIESSIETLNV